MTIPTQVQLLLTLVALSVSISALFAAYRTSARYLSKRLSEHSQQLADLSESHEQLTHQLRNLRSRLNMQSARARKREPEPAADEELPLAGPRAEEALDWKRKMNLQLALRGGPK